MRSSGSGVPTGHRPRTSRAGLNEVEELLAARLGADRQCLHVATLSTGGMRELVFYSSDPAATDAALRKLAAEVRTHVLQHIIQPDPKWRVYRQFG